MNTDSNALPHSLEGLLAHADWVRALARKLVRDDAEADDVAQEVWREAIEQPPRHDANPRGWLAAVARNAARAMKRGDRRRNDRERSTARPESLPSTAQLVEEASLSRELAGIVLELEEPYRTTMLLRWFREMEVDAIAKAQKVPRETVRTRLRRGLEMMREKLDAERGGREAWLSAFAPLVSVEIAPSIVATGVAVGTWLWISIAASVALAAWFACPRRSTARDEDKIAYLTADDLGYGHAVHESGKQELVESAVKPPASARAPNVLAAPSANSIPSADAKRKIDALIVDSGNHPVADFAIEWKSGLEPRWSGDTIRSGGFSVKIPPELRERLMLPQPELAMDPHRFDEAPLVWEVLTKGPLPRVHAVSDASGRLNAEIPELIAVNFLERVVLDPTRQIVAECRAHGESFDRWVVAPNIEIAGVVVDEAGDPVVGARIDAGLSWDSADPLPDLELESFNANRKRFTSTDHDGRFRLDHVSSGQQSSVDASARGMLSLSVPLPERDDLSMRLVMKRVDPREQVHVSGIVVDPTDAPVKDAWVELGAEGTSTNAEGRFDLTITTVTENAPLTATRPGHQAAVLPRFGSPKLSTTRDVVLRLGGPPLSLQGRVVDADGSPLAKCSVWLMDGTFRGTTNRTVEGASASTSGFESISNEQGAFEINGLQDRDYSLIAWHQDRGFIARLEHVPAGSKNVELKLDADEFVAEVAGRLVDAQGAPLDGASLSLSLTLSSDASSTRPLLYGKCSTSSDGTFILRNVPKRGVRVWVEGGGIRAETLELPDLSRVPLTLVAATQARVNLHVADAAVDQIEFLDASGARLSVCEHQFDKTSERTRIARVDGAFRAVDVSTSATIAVLMSADGSILRRAPITIRRAKKLTLDL